MIKATPVASGRLYPNIFHYVARFLPSGEAKALRTSSKLLIEQLPSTILYKRDFANIIIGSKKLPAECADFIHNHPHPKLGFKLVVRSASELSKFTKELKKHKLLHKITSIEFLLPSNKPFPDFHSCLSFYKNIRFLSISLQNRQKKAFKINNISRLPASLIRLTIKTQGLPKGFIEILPRSFIKADRPGRLLTPELPAVLPNSTPHLRVEKRRLTSSWLIGKGNWDFARSRWTDQTTHEVHFSKRDALPVAINLAYSSGSDITRALINRSCSNFVSHLNISYSLTNLLINSIIKSLFASKSLRHIDLNHRHLPCLLSIILKKKLTFSLRLQSQHELSLLQKNPKALSLISSIEVFISEKNATEYLHTLLTLASSMVLLEFIKLTSIHPLTEFPLSHLFTKKFIPEASPLRTYYLIPKIRYHEAPKPERSSPAAIASRAKTSGAQ